MRPMLTVFDGHNDTLTREDADGFATGREGGHVDLPRARAGGLGGGIFAAFTATPGDQPPEGEPAAPIGQELAAGLVTRTIGRLLALERAGHVAVARAPGDLDAAREAGVLAAVAHIEGAEAVDPGLHALELLHAAGLRSLGPVWSRPNAFAHGVPFAYPSSPDTGPGLTPAGRRLVRRCAELGIAVDLSHLNEAGFWDVAGLELAPLIASHSGAHALCPASRNLTDAQLDAIGASGGLVGIVYAVAFLRADGAEDPDTPLETIAAHVRHVADRIGVEHVALGSDFDGATIPRELGDAAGLPRLLDAIRAAGFSEDEMELIAWGNWRRVLEAAWAEPRAGSSAHRPASRTTTAAADAMSCTEAHSRTEWYSWPPVNRFGVGRPFWLRMEPSVPPRIGSRTGSIPSARIARSATSTTCGNVSTKRRMLGYCGRSVTETRERGSSAATRSAVRRIRAMCSASSASSKSRAMKRTSARPASPESA